MSFLGGKAENICSRGFGCGPVVLLHTQKIGIQSEKPTWTKALEFTQFACPCGTDPRLLSGEQRTSHFKLVKSVDDPGCVKTCTSQECAELFSLSSSLSSGRKHFWFSNLRNRDGISTRRLNVGVFTRPRPIPEIGGEAPARFLLGTSAQSAPGRAELRVPVYRGRLRQRRLIYIKTALI